MFRIWGKLIKENHLLKDTVICIPDKDINRTKKVYKSLEMICEEFDLAVPIWLENNKTEFIKHARTRFDQTNFIESIDFDYLDFHVIEEDHSWE
ncbi:MAG: hypothetical protein K6F55_07865 [Eubacterium sp.]|nr:hypothetical protein [Eubacterium sp.]